MTEPDALPEKKNKKLPAVKTVARFVVGHSVRFVVTTAITTLVPTDSKTQKVKLFVGAYVIADVMAESAKRHITGEIDDIVEIVDGIEFNKPPLEPEPDPVTPN